MSENEKKHEGQSCCCCQSWKAIFIAIAFMAIGAVIGHIMTMMHQCCRMMAMNHPYCQMMPMRHQCCHIMREPYGGDYGREIWRERGEREREGKFEHKFQEGKEQKGWFGHKSDRGKHQPGCTCPICSKKAAGLPEPNKAGCPMKDKK